MRSKLTGILLLLFGPDAAAQATWVVDRTPILDVPGVATTGTLIFGYAAGGMRLADGGLLIADRAENSIRVLDATGKLVRSVGRTGDGPGEFQSMMWAGRCGPHSLLASRRDGVPERATSRARYDHVTEPEHPSDVIGRVSNRP